MIKFFIFLGLLIAVYGWFSPTIVPLIVAAKGSFLWLVSMPGIFGPSGILALLSIIFLSIISSIIVLFR